jgi:hypothetical protein
LSHLILSVLEEAEKSGEEENQKEERNNG